MVNIIHRIGIKSSATKVYDALTSLTGLSHWWTEEVKGEEKLGGKIEFHFTSPKGEDMGTMIMEVLDLNPQKAVGWRCLSGPKEWIGTDITFDLSEQDGQTIVIFRHKNWREEVEFMGHCSMKWATFLLSLREYVETGKGKPSPIDLKIDNWN